MNDKHEVGLRRLLQLADHLEHGKLGHKKWNFSVWNANDIGKPTYEAHCGTMGCAVGECPILWPEEWGWAENGDPTLTDDHMAWPWPIDAACKFFNISRDAAAHLFLPGEQKPEEFGGRRLNGKATKEEVAKQIRLFVKWKAKKQRIDLTEKEETKAEIKTSTALIPFKKPFKTVSVEGPTSQEQRTSIR